MVNLFSSGMLEYMDYTVDLKPLTAKDPTGGTADVRSPVPSRHYWRRRPAT
jgi:hypothetical protein